MTLIIRLPDLQLFTQVVEHAKSPDHVAVNDIRLHLNKTYRQLLIDVSALRSRILKEVPHTSNEDLDECRIACLCPNGYAYVTSQLAVWAAGGIAVPLCISHPPAEMRYTVEDSQAGYIIAHESFKEKAENLAKVTDRPLGILKDHDPELNASAESSALDVRLFKLDETRRALIIYTSGTTGQPKGVVSSHHNVKAQILALVQFWRYSKEDRLHHVLPLHHIHGILCGLLCMLWSGGTVEIWPKFNGEEVWKRWIDGEKNVTLFMAVPTIYNRLVNTYSKLSPEEQKKATKACKQFRLQISGSAALPTPIKDRWKRLSGGQVLLERFGMSEVGMALSNGYESEKRVDGTVGIPLPGVNTRITTDDGQDITEEREQEGNLEIKGDTVFLEYWNRPDSTAKEFTSDGWFKTGDRALRRKEDGLYRILGRSSVDIIKSGGEKLSALDVERELLSLDYVSDAAVMGIEDPDLGQRVSAVIVATKEVKIKKLRDDLRSRLAPYKLPTMILQVNEIPKSAMGKVQKKQLSQIFSDSSHSDHVQKS